MILLPITALAAGSLMGATNGALVSFVKAPSIVVTLATMVAGREALRWITGGAWVEGLPANFQWFGLGQQVGQAMIIAVTLLVFAGLWWASQRVWAFRAVYATGSDAEAARLAGISTQWVKFWVFVLMGALTGIASLLNAVRFSDVPANGGINLELKTIAAVVVGGTPITGGRGSLLGTFVGVLLLGSIEPALTFLGINPYWEKAIQGALILGTVLVDALNARREKRMVLA
jgi:rhamnose transport system permease protein